jgi:hypothetical protein
MNFEILFNGIPMEWIDESAGCALAENCSYVIPSAPVEEKLAFFGLVCIGNSFLEAGVGHFNPAYKSDKENGRDF